MGEMVMADGKLVVEFEVERESEVGYGLVEKYLRFRGEKTGYKAITKNGRLLAIVGRGYKLIPNQVVKQELERLAREQWLLEELSSVEDNRYYAVVKRSIDDKKAVLVHNSIDASLVLGVRLMLRVGGGYTVIVGKEIEQVRRYHRKNLMVDDLVSVIKEIYEAGEKYEKVLAELEKVSVAPEHIETVRGLLPEKYTKDAVFAKNLKELYERVAVKLWNAKIDMVTKMAYYKDLNDFVTTVVAWGANNQ